MRYFSMFRPPGISFALVTALVASNVAPAAAMQAIVAPIQGDNKEVQPAIGTAPAALTTLVTQAIVVNNSAEDNVVNARMRAEATANCTHTARPVDHGWRDWAQITSTTASNAHGQANPTNAWWRDWSMANNGHSVLAQADARPTEPIGW